MRTYLLVAVGSALGGMARYGLTRWTLGWSGSFPWGTVLVNLLGAFAIGFFGTLTLASGRYAVSEELRLFIMVGVCGGFTTFSSFSLQSFDLLRAGAWARALGNIGLSVTVCLLAVAAGHLLAHHAVLRSAVAATVQEEAAA